MMAPEIRRPDPDMLPPSHLRFGESNRPVHRHFNATLAAVELRGVDENRSLNVRRTPGLWRRLPAVEPGKARNIEGGHCVCEERD